jgi:hypothetical protein
MAASTWGTSVAENVPDILKSSGLCSFRSWYENRKMAEANQCVQGSCNSFKGVFPWNFSDHTSPNSAFDDGVLKVRAHPCDREYQFYEGFVSCTPSEAFLGIFNAVGQKTTTRAQLDSRTRTYRSDKTLPLMSLARGEKTKGFTGIPKTYAELGLGAGDPMVKPCSKINVCGLQPGFKVNGKTVTRMVLDSGVVREYSVMDMITCGAFGFIITGVTGSVQCTLDYAVVPLAYAYKYYKPTILSSAQYLSFVQNGVYAKGDLINVFNQLKQLPDIFIQKFIGATPTTFSEYMDGTEKFIVLHDRINTVSKPYYEEVANGGGQPKQIYYITTRGVYEVPFVWWFRCVWLGGMSMAEYEISSAECPLVPLLLSSGKQPQQQQLWPEIVFPPYNPKLKNLFSGVVSPPFSLSDSTRTTTVINNGTLLNILKRLPGVIPRAIFNKVSDQFKERRNLWLDKLRQILENTVKKCFEKRVFIDEYASRSEEYQLKWMDSYQQGWPFDTTGTYKDAYNLTVCSGMGCLRSEFPGMATLSKATGFGEQLLNYFTSTNIQIIDTAAMRLDQLLAGFSDDWYVYISNIAKSDNVDGYKWSELRDTYPEIPNGCTNQIRYSVPHKEGENCVCKQWGGCSTTLQNRMLGKSSIPKPMGNEYATVNLDGVGSLKVCSDIFQPPTLSKEDCCIDSNALVPGSNFSLLKKMQVPFGISLDAYQQEAWDCARFTCVDTAHPFHNKLRPIENKFPSSRTVEQVVMKEVAYYQKTFTCKVLPWETQATENSELNLYAGVEMYCMPMPEKDRTPYMHMPFRETTEGLEFKVRVYVFEYLINGTKIAEVETFPCAEDIEFDFGLFSDTMQKLGISNKQSVQWPKAVDEMNKFNTYRKNQQQQVGKICNSEGPEGGIVPAADTLFDVLQPRNITTNAQAMTRFGIQSNNEVISRIQSVISTIHAQINAEQISCLNSGCVFEQSNTRSFAKIRETYTSSDKTMQDFCGKQKQDAIYGCKMFPGEAVTQQEHCSRYGDWGSQRWDCENKGDPYPCAWSQYRRCLLDSQDNGCYNDYEPDSENFVRKYRNTRPEGKTVDYELRTFTPECVAGPTAKCKLSTEHPSILAGSPDKKLGFCPSTNGAASRSRLFNQMKPTLNTAIDYLLTLPDENGVSEVEVEPGYVDHIYMSLDPLYTCGSTAPACGDQMIPIEVRSRLWRCAQCPLVSNTYCTGQHSCRMESPGIPVDSLYNLDGWDTALTDQERAFLTGANASIDVAISSARWLVTQTMNLAMPGVGMAHIVPEFMRTYNDGEPDFTYNPLPIIAYSNAMDARADSCTTQGVIPDFTNCSYDGNRRRLRDFINSTTTGYKIQDGVIIPPQATLVWQISKSQMVSHNIPAWMGTESRAGMFWRDLFDDRWCKRGNMQDNACYVTTALGKTVVEVLNPGLLGDFEPLIGCDTRIINGQRVINAMCPICPPLKTADDVLDLLVTESTPMACPSYYKAVSGVTSNLGADSNLCGKEPAYESTCANLQGMLGHTVYDGDPVQSLYSRVAWRGSLPPGLTENPLFRQGGAGVMADTASNLALKLTDIGGHCVSMEIRNTSSGKPVMTVVELPLSSYTGMSDANSKRDSTKLKWMQISTARELDRINSVYPNSVCATWDCPLRRRAFYTTTTRGAAGASSSSFRPLIPDPLRTHVLYGTRVHPTQSAAPLPMSIGANIPTLGIFYTYNGFCACVTSSSCPCKSDEDALTGVWQTAAAYGGCTKQMDWPYPGGS